MRRLIDLLRSRRRGSNAIEWFFAMAPIIFMSLVYVQFYFLASNIYFGLTKAYATAFKTALASTSSPTISKGKASVSVQVNILSAWRSRLWNQQSKSWSPPGPSEYWVGGGARASMGYLDFEWIQGFPGLFQQYADFPWTGMSSGQLNQAATNPQILGAGAPSQNTGTDAQGDAADAQAQAKANACSNASQKLFEISLKEPSFNYCRSNGAWTQSTDPDTGQPLYYTKDIFGQYNFGSPTTANTGHPAYPPAHYQNSCNEMGSQASAQNEYDQLMASKAQLQDTWNQWGCP